MLKQRQVEQVIRGGLKELAQNVQGNKPEAFFATLFHLLQERLGERLDLPASAITEAVVEERLRHLSVPETTLASLRELFQICNQARYGLVEHERGVGLVDTQGGICLERIAENKGMRLAADKTPDPSRKKFSSTTDGHGWTRMLTGKTAEL